MFNPSLKLYVIELEDGSCEKVIAETCNISFNMVKFRLGSIFKEYKVSNVSEFWEDTSVRCGELSIDSELSVRSILEKEQS